nr:MULTISPECIES: hypothetical protein [unclassified Bacillus (in: firmicutes)]
MEESLPYEYIDAIVIEEALCVRFSDEDGDIEDLIKNATDTGFFHVECIEKLRNYLLENYLVDSALESGAITKEEIMKMVDNN